MGQQYHTGIEDLYIHKSSTVSGHIRGDFALLWNRQDRQMLAQQSLKTWRSPRNTMKATHYYWKAALLYYADNVFFTNCHRQYCCKSNLSFC